MTAPKPSAGFWITVVLVAVLLGYPLSFGPACWIAARTSTSESRLFQAAYWPLGRIIHSEVPMAHNILWDYAGMGLPGGSVLMVPGGPDDEGRNWLIIGEYPRR